MSCDEGLVQRIREALQGVGGTDEKRMFGGMCFTLNGHMLCGVIQDERLVRLGPQDYAAALKAAHVRQMDLSGRSMTGYALVAEPAYRADTALHRWLGTARGVVETLPRKAANSVAKRAAKGKH
jgi:TfoX/Sxy family transcriptional regulator of competence genes